MARNAVAFGEWETSGSLRRPYRPQHQRRVDNSTDEANLIACCAIREHSLVPGRRESASRRVRFFSRPWADVPGRMALGRSRCKSATNTDPLLELHQD